MFSTLYSIDAVEENLHVRVTFSLALIEENSRALHLVCPVDGLVLLLVERGVLRQVLLALLGLGHLLSVRQSVQGKAICYGKFNTNM